MKNIVIAVAVLAAAAPCLAQREWDSAGARARELVGRAAQKPAGRARIVEQISVVTEIFAGSRGERPHVYPEARCMGGMYIPRYYENVAMLAALGLKISRGRAGGDDAIRAEIAWPAGELAGWTKKGCLTFIGDEAKTSWTAAITELDRVATP